MTPPIESFDDQIRPNAYSTDPLDPGPIALVKEGMVVVDAAGDDIGKVSSLRMGDPEAVTTEGQETPDVGLSLLGGNDDRPDLPESFRNELVRVGYIAIDRKGIFTSNAFARSDQIAGVVNDVVRLTVRGEDLPTD